MGFQTRGLELFGNQYGSPVESGFSPPSPHKLSKCVQGNMEEK